MSPELLLGLFIVGGLTLYLLLGGADFGAGIWELLLFRREDSGHRELINRAIGPVWETNHVWLIFAVVIIHTAFPSAYATIFQALWIPLLLALVGIVLRGTAFALRYHAEGEELQEALWSVVFVGASALAAFFIGASLGALARGALEVSPAGRFEGSFLTGWISPLSLFVGLFTVGLCAYLAAAYLTRDASREGARTETVEEWRRRSLVMGLAMGVMAMAGLGVVAIEAPTLREGFADRAWPLAVVSLVAGWASLWALWVRRFTLAVVGVATTTATVVWGWALAQYPWVIPPSVTIDDAKAEDTVLWVTFWALMAGGVLLLPSLVWLFYLFKGHKPVGSREGPRSAH